MPAPPFVERLNEQIGHEFAAHQQYVAIAVHYEAETLPRLASFFYAQALEERNHALMMVRFLLDQGIDPTIPGVDAPESAFEDVVAPVALGLAQERRVTNQINELAGIARQHQDYTSEQFMQWFIKEQTEEIATMSPKPVWGAVTPGISGSTPASSRYWTIISAWLRSSSAWA